MDLWDFIIHFTGPLNLTFTLIVMTELPYLHLVVH
jgi:hypothetical protein